MSTSKKPEDVLETVLDEDFMKITTGDPDYTIEVEDGPPGYEQEIVSILIENVREDVMQSFRADYNSLGDTFDKWAKEKGFVSSQILEGEGSSLVFEVTAISS